MINQQVRRMLVTFWMVGTCFVFMNFEDQSSEAGRGKHQIAQENLKYIRRRRDLKSTNYIDYASNPWAKEYSLPFCSCKRLGLKLNRNSDDLKESTCSDFATQRGDKQNVLSYSYFNPTNIYEKDSFHTKKYLQSLLDRADEIKRFYPGWLMRLYHNVSDHDPEGKRVLCNLFCNHDHVDLCDVRNLPSLGNIHDKQSGPSWRFIVMGDPTIHIFNCRDADSIIQEREIDAVLEWLESNQTFHVMRDHPDDLDVMLAGLWGCKNYQIREGLVSLRNRIFSKPVSHNYGYDQYLLANEVWPLAKESVLQHDSFTCQLKTHANSYPFPTQRTNGLYVGWGPHHKESAFKRFNSTKCPVQCRPLHHKDWEMC